MDRIGFSYDSRIFVACTFVAFLLAGTAAGEVSRDGLVAEWLFDEGSGNILKDSSGNGNDGAIYGATWVDGKFGMALSFDGVDDYVEVQDSPNLNPSYQITIEAWYRPVSFIGNGNDAILDKPFTSHISPYYEYHLGVAGDGYRNYPGSFGFDTSINNNWVYINSGEGFWKSGQWYHIIGIYDGSAVKLYVNSKLITSKPASGQINNYGMNVRIGNTISLNYYLYGTIDEIRIYDRALSADEVKANYETSTIPSAPKITLTKILSPSTVTASGSTTISIKVENNGIDTKNIKVTDTIPQGFTLISGAITQEYASLKAGESRTFGYILKSPSAGKYVTEKATATYSDYNGNSYTSASNAVTISVSDVPPQTIVPIVGQQTYRPAQPPQTTSESSNSLIYAGIGGVMILFVAVIALRKRNNSQKLEQASIQQTGIIHDIRSSTKLKKESIVPDTLTAQKDTNDTPNILVSITSSKGFKVGIWEKLNVNILNVGEGMARDIEIKLSGPLETSGYKMVQVLEGHGSQTDIVIGVKPKEPGNIPLKVEVVFFDQNGKRYRMTEEAFISVAKESETISLRQTPIINIGSIGTYVGEHVDNSTKVVDSMIQRSTIGVGLQKCRNCGREVEAKEKFCLECGARI